MEAAPAWAHPQPKPTATASSAASAVAPDASKTPAAIKAKAAEPAGADSDARCSAIYMPAPALLTPTHSLIVNRYSSQEGAELAARDRTPSDASAKDDATDSFQASVSVASSSSSSVSLSSSSAALASHTSAFQSKPLPPATATQVPPPSSSSSTSSSSHPAVASRIARSAAPSKKPEPPPLKAPLADRAGGSAPAPPKKVAVSDKACQFGSGAPAAGGKNSVTSCAVLFLARRDEARRSCAMQSRKLRSCSRFTRQLDALLKLLNAFNHFISTFKRRSCSCATPTALSP